MLNKLKEKLDQAKEKLQSTETDVKLLVPDEVAKQRFDICLQCEHLYHKTNTCKLCGCFMKIKTTLSNQTCPAKKWGKHTIEK